MWGVDWVKERRVRTSREEDVPVFRRLLKRRASAEGCCEVPSTLSLDVIISGGKGRGGEA